MAFNQYAQYYDVFYKDKNYNKECHFLEELLAKYYKGNPKSILDLGCGTGNYMIPLLKRGYDVVGLDASKQMLALAKKKPQLKDIKRNLICGKLQSFNLGKKFDVAICMFSVIDYLLKDKDIISTIKNVAKHMHSKSVFIFDFWRASAVEGYYSPRKKRKFYLEDKILERQSDTNIFQGKRICEVNYLCSLKKKGRIIEKFKEKHAVRYFSTEEMLEFLRKSGLKVLGVHPFLRMNGKIRKNTWDVTIVARRA